MIDYVPTIHAPSISLGQNWLPTELKIEIPPSQWSEETCIQEAQFFSLVWWWEHGIHWEFFVLTMFHMVLSCFHQILNRFPKFSIFSQHVPNSTTLHPISFAQKFSSCNLQGETYNISILSAQSLITIFCDGQIKDAHYQKARRKLNIWGAPN